MPDEKGLRLRMQTRLQELRREAETGQTELDSLDRRRTQLVETLLRISGAIQVLEETLGEHLQPTGPEPVPTPGASLSQ